MSIFLMKDLGQTFVPANPEPNKSYRQIPKHNKRFLELEPSIIEERTIELSVSSDTPYYRWFGYEELDHSPEAVDLTRFNDGANVLFNHNRDDYIGVIQKAWLDGGRLYNKIKFDTHELAEKIYQSIKSGIIRNVSIGYEINEMALITQRDDIDVYRAVRWTPFESSIVTVPADHTVGINRSYFVIGEGEDLGGNVSEVKDMPKSSIEELTIGINEKDIVTSERERVQGIYALVKKYGHAELAQRAIEESLSIESARSLYLDKVNFEEKQNPVAAGVSPVGMSRKQRQQYSAIKAIGYAAGLIAKDKVGLELEVSQALTERTGKAPKKIYIDQSELVAYRAPYETGVPAAAGDLIETELLSDRFVEQLFNQSAFLEMGVTYLRDLTGNIEIPRESTYSNGYWIGEKAIIPESEGTFDKISLAPKKLAVLSKMTFEMLEQSSIDLERLVRARLIRGLALELDRTIGFGSGIGSEPLGIASHPEVKSIVLGVNGAPLTWEGLIDMQTELSAANALTDDTSGYVINARTRGKLMKTLDQPTGGGNWIYQSQGGNMGSIAGYKALCSNQIPNNLVKGTASNLTAAFFGDFSNVLLGIWSGMDVMANPYSEFNQAIIQIRAMQLADLNLTRGDYFVVATDVLNT
ncbi:MAG: phage major capsid protein [Pleurocapsa sp. SU_5_0]|nr:phage major capsid protein [Pleurocapsa sp. SU_5_0]